MNLKNLSLITVLAMGMFACGEAQQEQTTNEEVSETTEEVTDASTEATSYAINTTDSKVAWSGGTSGAQVYGHNGVIDIKEGSITAEGNVITGGNITIDMTTIQPLDEGYSEEHPKSQLIGHLTTGDFFLVDSFPTSSFTIKSMEGSTITGDLTIRGNTNEEQVTDVQVEMVDGSLKASGKLVFDRQKYDVAWKHYVKDVILSDEIALEIELSANAQ